MADPFSTTIDTPTSPSRSVYTVTPSDGVALPRLPKALYVGTGGHVVLRCVDDSADVTFKNVPSGAVLRTRAAYVRSTGTTAADIVAHC